MRDNQIDIQEISNITAAIAHHQGLISYITQLDPKQRDKLVEFYQSILDKYKIKHISNVVLPDWMNINLHVISQMWGSTSCGWGGMGGAAMTSSYTTVLENPNFGIISVYYSGRLAYIAKMDDKLKEYPDYKHLPGIPEVKKLLTTIYVK